MMEKVIVTRAIIGFYTMQVCAHKDATDDEILAVANRENPSGIQRGWANVCRRSEDHPDHPAVEGKTLGAVPCADYGDRLHILLTC